MHVCCSMSCLSGPVSQCCLSGCTLGRTQVVPGCPGWGYTASSIWCSSVVVLQETVPHSIQSLCHCQLLSLFLLHSGLVSGWSWPERGTRELIQPENRSSLLGQLMVESGSWSSHVMVVWSLVSAQGRSKGQGTDGKATFCVATYNGVWLRQLYNQLPNDYFCTSLKY